MLRTSARGLALAALPGLALTAALSPALTAHAASTSSVSVSDSAGDTQVVKGATAAAYKASKDRADITGVTFSVDQGAGRFVGTFHLAKVASTGFLKVAIAGNVDGKAFLIAGAPSSPSLSGMSGTGIPKGCRYKVQASQDVTAKTVTLSAPIACLPAGQHAQKSTGFSRFGSTPSHGIASDNTANAASLVVRPGPSH